MRPSTCLHGWVLLLTLIIRLGEISAPDSASSCLGQCPSTNEGQAKELTVSVLLPGRSTESDLHDLFHYNQLEDVKPVIEMMTLGPDLWRLNNVSTLRQILPGWTFRVQGEDTQCSSTFGPLKAFDLHCQTDVFLGPVCPYVLAPVGRYSKTWNTPIITTGGQVDTFRSRVEFPFLTTMSGTYKQFALFFKKLLSHFNWHIVSFLFHTYPVGSDKGKSSCQFSLGEIYTQMGGRANANLSYRSFDEEALNDTLAQELLKEAESLSRVVIMCASPLKVRDIMLAAESLGMMAKGEYVFFNIELFASRKSGEYKPWLNPNATDEENQRAKRAFEAVLTVTASSSYTAEYENFSATVKSLSKRLFNYDYPEQVSSFVANFHDAVLLYATALKEVVELYGMEAKSNGKLIVSKMWDRTISGISGEVNIDSNGDRKADYALLDMDPVSGEFMTVGVYRGLNSSFELNTSRPIHWPNREGLGPPLDEPVCGFDGSRCKTGSVTNTIIIVASVVGAFFLVSFGVVIRHYRREAEILKMTWLIQEEEIEDMTASKPQMGSFMSLHVYDNGSMDGNMDGKRQIFIMTKKYKNSVVAYKEVQRDKIDIDRSLKVELNNMKSLRHDHLVQFLGANLSARPKFLITEYCSRGSLQDVLEKDELKLDWNFRHSLMNDIIKGLSYLEKSALKFHGNLKSSNCVVDSRFVLKLTDFGLHSLRQPEKSPDEMEHRDWKNLLWTAPEILRMDTPQEILKSLSTSADVYAFGIILEEIVFRKGPFFLGDESSICDPKDIVEGVRKVQEDEAGKPRYLRPSLTVSNASDGASGGGGCVSGSSAPSKRDPNVLPQAELTQLMQECWSEDPRERPDFASLRARIKELNKDNESRSLLDNLLNRMEQYANNLEALVNERTEDYLEEKRKCQEVLYQLLPPSVADQLIRGENVIAETFNDVTIYFSDIVGFTALSAESKPLEIVDLLNDLYTVFDNVIEDFEVYKIETIGDAYMVVSGLPTTNGDRHAKEIARMALSLLERVKTFEVRHKPDHKLQLRIGIHTGPCCAGVVGVKMPRYCLFGDTVNTASRMESTGLPLKIHVSPETKNVLDKFDCFELEKRGEVEMKGKGKIFTYWLLGEKPPNPKTEADPPSTSNAVTGDFVKASSDGLSQSCVRNLPQITTTSFSNDLQPQSEPATQKMTSSTCPPTYCRSNTASVPPSAPPRHAHFQVDARSTYEEVTEKPSSTTSSATTSFSNCRSDHHPNSSNNARSGTRVPFSPLANGTKSPYDEYKDVDEGHSLICDASETDPLTGNGNPPHYMA